MLLFSGLVLAFYLVLVLTALINVLTNNYLLEGKPEVEPFLSVLIPARNEGKNLPILLEGLQKMEYSNFEVVVCNDHSTDNTIQVLDDFSKKIPTMHYFTGEVLPEGWSGKNFACHQLAQKASGEYLLFLDADVCVEPQLFDKATFHIMQKKLHFLSIFPEQIMESTGEKIVVSLMNWILLSLLPLPLVYSTLTPSLSAANGQFMLFEATLYYKNQWHHKVKSQNVEDILIARKLKQEGGKMATLLGNNDISCRMYKSGKEAVNGLARSVHQFFGGNRLLMVLFMLITTWSWVSFLTYSTPIPFTIWMVLLIVNRILVIVASRQKWTTLLLLPLQMFTFTQIVLKNIVQSWKGETTWKGRKLKF